MLDADSIRQGLTEYITNEILHDPERVLPPGEPLITSGLIDSFHLVDIALFVEDTFGVRIEDSELTADSFDNLLQLVEIVVCRMRKGV